MRSTLRVHTPFKKFVSCFGTDGDGKTFIVCVSCDGKYGKFYFDLSAKTSRADVLADLLGGPSAALSPGSPQSSSSASFLSPTASADL